MILNVLLNVTVVFLLVNTKLYKNPSFLLILFMSINDCCLGFKVQPFEVYSDGSNYSFDIIAQFFGVLITHISAYTVGLIGFDRYYRMKCLNRYPEFVRTKKVDIACLMVILMSSMQAISHTFGTLLNIYSCVVYITVFIDLCTAMLIFLACILTVLTVKQHRSNATHQDILNNIEKPITSVTSKILIVIAVCYTLHILLLLLCIIYWLLKRMGRV